MAKTDQLVKEVSKVSLVKMELMEILVLAENKAQQALKVLQAHLGNKV